MQRGRASAWVSQNGDIEVVEDTPPATVPAEGAPAERGLEPAPRRTKLKDEEFASLVEQA
jgi:hypothetical protein